jgi:arsenate reductase (glutaredoxin)
VRTGAWCLDGVTTAGGPGFPFFDAPGLRCAPMKVTVYHNPRCSKSRETLELLRARGHDPEIVLYLEHPPDAPTLRGLVRKLNIQPKDLLRRKEAVYSEIGLADRLDDEDAVIRAMQEHPVLIERPIVVVGSKARIGRPPERVLEILP